MDGLPEDWNAALAPTFPDGATHLGIGVIGAGAIVNAAHLPAYRQVGLRVRGIYDVHGERAQATGRRFGLEKIYPSVVALLDDPTVDIVDIAVPAPSQYAILEQALAAGKHVLCQKPLAPTWEGVQRTMRLVAAHPRCKVAVNQQMRWTPVIRSLSLLLERKLLGTPVQASMQVSVYTDWRQWPWLLSEPYLLGPYNTIHLIDSFRLLFGTPTRVYARTGRVGGQPARGETQLFLSMEYPDDLIAFIHDHHTNESPDRYATVRCEGVEGMAKGTIGIWENYPEGGPDSFEFWSKRDGASLPHRPRITRRWVPDAFSGPMADLMTAIVQNTAPTLSVEDNCATLATVFAAMRSAQAKRIVALAELLP